MSEKRPSAFGGPIGGLRDVDTRFFLRTHAVEPETHVHFSETQPFVGETHSILRGTQITSFGRQFI